MIKFIKLFKEKDKSSKDSVKTTHQSLREKYQSFQSLLEHNEKVLMLIADIEEKLREEYLFDQQYVKTSLTTLRQDVTAIIDELNKLSHDKYRGLSARLDSINSDIDAVVSPRSDIPVSDLVIPLERLSGNMGDISGNKIARLGDIRNHLGLPAPDGFSITAFAFKRFMDHNHLTKKINDVLPGLSVGNKDDLNAFCRTMRDEVMNAELPADLENALDAALTKLTTGVSPSFSRFSVRSSALREDGEVSFAGQYATFLNVPPELVARKYKEVLASVFRPRAVYYFKTKGFSEHEMVMSVGVLPMIDARAGGVAYTTDPNAPESDRIIISAAWGLGKAVVDGVLIPQTYVVSRVSGDILEKTPSEQRVMLVCADSGDIGEAPVPEERRGERCLSDDQIRELARYALVLERHYGKPQDIEWAADREGRLFLLQSRTLKTLTQDAAVRALPRRLDRYPVLIDRGLVASRGVGCGRAFVMKGDADLKDFPEGGVLVAENMAADFVTVMDKAAAMVIDKGGVTGHLAALAREYAVPVIVASESGTRVIEQGREITVDAVHCNVYAGRAAELLKFKERESSFRDTRVFRTLERAFERVAPLNLLCPGDADFVPERCMTYHDITRFSHEKAMEVMFSLGEDHDMDDCHAVPLKAGIPMDAHIIDLGGGLAAGASPARPEDIRSIPFAAFLKGMMGMRWPEPRPPDAKGFFGMVANTASIPECELRETASRSYAVLSEHYMNFSIRLGYHFSAVEAYAGENINGNYIKFHFKGGGAATDRRLRRIRLIAEILKKLGFTLDIKGDVMDAAFPKYSRADMEGRLEIMGKLTAYTKQLDMALYNDAVLDLFLEDFLKDHANDR